VRKNINNIYIGGALYGEGRKNSSVLEFQKRQRAGVEGVGPSPKERVPRGGKKGEFFVRWRRFLENSWGCYTKEEKKPKERGGPKRPARVDHKGDCALKGGGSSLL